MEERIKKEEELWDDGRNETTLFWLPKLSIIFFVKCFMIFYLLFLPCCRDTESSNGTFFWKKVNHDSSQKFLFTSNTKNIYHIDIIYKSIRLTDLLKCNGNDEVLGKMKNEIKIFHEKWKSTNLFVFDTFCLIKKCDDCIKALVDEDFRKYIL